MSTIPFHSQEVLFDIPDSPPPRDLWLPSSVRRRGIEATRSAAFITNLRGEPDQIQLMEDLDAVVAAEINRHTKIRKPWVPRDFMPIDADGRIIGWAGDRDPNDPLLSPDAQAAMIVNLLTEDNLPGYHATIRANTELVKSWREWLDIWTAEEGRHAYVMRSYLDLTEAVDVGLLEEDRMAHMEHSYHVEKDVLHTIAYVTFQELATRVSHRNTGDAVSDELGKQMLIRIAADENLHMLFYRNLVAAALDRAPNQMMRAITDEVVEFQMPGSDMDEFKSLSAVIATAGIYDLKSHLEDVVLPILKQWKIFERGDFTGYGNQAREELATFLDSLGIKAERFSDMRQAGKLTGTRLRALSASALRISGQRVPRNSQ